MRRNVHSRPPSSPAVRRASWTGGLLLVLLLYLAVPTGAHAAFPGTDGKIAFGTNDGDIYAINPDGTQRTNLTNNPAADGDPAWSPSGREIAFASDRSGSWEIHVMNADGSGVRQITNNALDDYGPAWSPDGTKIAFVENVSAFGAGEIYSINSDGTGMTDISNNADHDSEPSWSPDGTKIVFGRAGNNYADVYVMNPDGSAQTRLTDHPAADSRPDWSPDGTTIALDSFRTGNWDIFEMNPDGTGQVNLSNNPGLDTGAAWSPSGTKIAFLGIPVDATQTDVFVMNADGTGRTNLTAGTAVGAAAQEGEPVDWQPVQSYVRPRGATPLRVSLVPAYTACTSPNRTHGAPLAHGSCAPPVQTSSNLTIGTPDANGQADQSIGSVTVKTILGNESTPADEADLRIDTTITDVRRVTGLVDYNGELSTVLQVRLTDRLYDAQTVQGFPFRVTVPCTPTTDTTIGSTCALVTTADSVMPGAVREASRAVWALEQIEVYDGGPDGLASTTAGNTLFETQGVFVP